MGSAAVLTEFLKILHHLMKLFIREAVCEYESHREEAFNILEATFDQFDWRVHSLQRILDEEDGELEMPHDIADEILQEVRKGFLKTTCALEIVHSHGSSYVHLRNKETSLQIEPFYEGAHEVIRLKFMKDQYLHIIYLSSWFCSKSIEVCSKGIGGSSGAFIMVSNLLYKYNNHYDVDITNYTREDKEMKHPLYTLTTREDDGTSDEESET